MTTYFVKTVAALLERVHLKIFGYEMSFMMRDFLKNLSWSFFGVLASSAIMFASTIAIGRILGPEEYGKYNLVLAIANFVMVFMFVGLDSTSVKFISGSKSQKEKKAYISNSFWFLVVSSFLVCLLMILTREKIANLIGTDTDLIVISSLMAVFLSFKILFNGFIKSLDKFKLQAITKIIESVLLLLLVLVSYFFFSKEYSSYVLPAVISSFFVIILMAFPVINFISAWDKQFFMRIKNYLKLAAITSFVGVIAGSLDKFFIARIIGYNELGVYSAYLMSSTVIMSQLIVATGNVFFPTVNKITDKKDLIKKTDQALKYAALPIIIFMLVVSFLSLKLFGSQYEIKASYLFSVSFLAFLQVVASLYLAVASSSRLIFEKIIRVYIFKPIFIALLYVLIYLTGLTSISSVLIVMMLVYIFDIISIKIVVKNHYKNLV